MPDYPLTPGSVTDPFCPTTWQQVLEELAARMTVTLPSINGFIAQSATPDVADQDKVWVKTSASAPYVLGFYRFEGGAWRLVPAPVTASYFVDTGAANTWTITTGESIPDNAAYITGRIWIVRVANDVSGATTLQIDSFAAKGVKKQNDQDLEAGDIESGQLALVAYDATAGVFELLTTLGEQQSPYKAAVLKKTGATNTAAQSITSTTETTVEFNYAVDPDGFVTLGANQITLATGTYQFRIVVPIRYVAGAVSGLIILRDVTAGNVLLATGTFTIDTETDDSYVFIEHVVTVAGATNQYDIRFYANQTVALGNPANLSSYDETYQQWSILKLA